MFVGNLSYDTTQSEVESLFSEVGQVVGVFMPADRITGRPRGFAFVEFAEEATAAKAIERLDGYELKGRSIRVNQAEERRPRSPAFADTGSFGMPRGRGEFKRKGSRRNIRAKKRSL
ncbi:MAG: RNA recognition motif domain-containing protein [Candidatus Methylomirabilales bacterium]